MTERWLPVPGYAGLYEVSDMGNVRSARRRRGSRGGLLKPALTGGPPAKLCVVLYGGTYASRKTRLVHQLVLEAFAGPRPPGELALHGPGGALDNRLANLYWGTGHRNCLDTVRDGTVVRGEKVDGAKLTEAAVLECRRRYAAGEAQTALAAELGINSASMSQVITGRTWAWLPGAAPVDHSRHGAKGEAHPAAKLTAAQAAEIRRRYAAGESQRPLAREFGISQPVVSKVVRGELWK